jgi:hypothetical protein
MTKRCSDCRDGEHTNYDDNVYMVVVHDPDTGKLVKRSYMCEAHRQAYYDDGYRLTKCL